MGAEEELRDPRGYVTVPPSVVVKVTGTGRSDINGLLGLVTSYNIGSFHGIFELFDALFCLLSFTGFGGSPRPLSFCWRRF